MKSKRTAIQLALYDSAVEREEWQCDEGCVRCIQVSVAVRYRMMVVALVNKFRVGKVLGE